MSVTVGIVRNGKTHLAADSFSGNRNSRNRSTISKLFRVGEAIIGFSGDVTVRNAIRYRLSLPSRDEGEGDEHYMAVKFVDALREAVRSAGRLEKSDSLESANNWLLVGYRGSLYTISSDFAVGSYDRDYHAVGAGEEYALGALHALHGRKNMSVDSILEAALDAACEHSPWCAKPYLKESA